MSQTGIPQRILRQLEHGEKVLWWDRPGRSFSMRILLRIAVILAAIVLMGILSLITSTEVNVEMIGIALVGPVACVIVCFAILILYASNTYYLITSKRILTISPFAVRAAYIKATTRCGGQISMGLHSLTFDHEVNQTFVGISDYKAANEALEQVIKALK